MNRTYFKLAVCIAAISCCCMSVVVHGVIIPLDGGSLLTADPVTVAASDTEQVSFSFVSRWDDGVMWAAYILAHNTENEQVVRIYSPDDGQTWLEPTFFFHSTFGASNAVQLNNGKIVSIHCGDPESYTIHQLNFFQWETSTTPYVQTQPNIMFPFTTTLKTHRSLIAMPDGRLLQSVYGKRNGQDSFTAFTIKSDDMGQSWTYLSDIATPQSNDFESGPNETAMTLLADGSVLALVRQGHADLGPLVLCKSYDGGETWTTPLTVDSQGGLDPDIIRLDDNTLIASYGRRHEGVYLMVDFTGTGDHWQQMQFYSGLGSDYTSLVQSGPQQIEIYYDISGYGSQELAAGLGPNRFVYQTIYAAALPEPSTLTLVGLCGGGLLRRKRG